ncbi:MAG: helix-turn-helix transcriptional regulator [Planctomycetaceae bacterium]|nr:helix-turn-helix transcriptional regulator [Planctomycetaceae bacterium]
MDDSIVDSDRQFLADLNQIGSATVPQLCEQEGVTATAIRQRLLRLQAAGLVSRQSVRATRGRPHHEYQLTDEGQRVLGNNYAELASLLWDQLNLISDEQVKKKMLAGLRDTLVKRYGASVKEGNIADRLRDLKHSLVDQGFNIEIEQEGALLTLTEQNCPYHDLASKDHTICDLEHEVFEKILGVSLNLSQRCVDGHNCCRFEVAEIDIK